MTAHFEVNTKVIKNETKTVAHFPILDKLWYELVEAHDLKEFESVTVMLGSLIPTIYEEISEVDAKGKPTTRVVPVKHVQGIAIPEADDPIVLAMVKELKILFEIFNKQWDKKTEAEIELCKAVRLGACRQLGKYANAVLQLVKPHTVRGIPKFIRNFVKLDSQESVSHVDISMFVLSSTFHISEQGIINVSDFTKPFFPPILRTSRWERDGGELIDCDSDVLKTDVTKSESVREEIMKKLMEAATKDSRWKTPTTVPNKKRVKAPKAEEAQVESDPGAESDGSIA